jgi:hypothetical protein
MRYPTGSESKRYCSLSSPLATVSLFLHPRTLSLVNGLLIGSLHVYKPRATYNSSFYLEEGFALGVTYKSLPSTAARWVSQGQGCWSWVELENLFRAYTGLASARDILL